MDWRPIETAPKDGTNIFVWCDGYEWPEVIRYELYDAQIADEVGIEGYWRYSDPNLMELMPVFDEAPTYWAPLPPPPEETPR